VPASRRPTLAVAVTVPDIESIVKAVGGPDIATFSLLRGCILRRDLLVEADVTGRLLTADAVVWTGFFGESSAIAATVERLPQEQRAALRQPAWIDVSRDAARINVPISSCEGYVEPQFMYGDPFFWLNPSNGRVIARNVADGLARLRPERRQFYADNAERFATALDAAVVRWTQELAELKSFRVFATQCGWQNLAQLGGPTFLTCRRSPGTLDEPEALAEQLNAQSVNLIIVDPKTPPKYAEVFRARTKAKVVTVPSSIGSLPGDRTYSRLFDNFIQVLRTSLTTP
jgi:ABC-type Zn uptake system ZnuABC Zn-binding protein ZnuA